MTGNLWALLLLACAGPDAGGDSTCALSVADAVCEDDREAWGRLYSCDACGTTWVCTGFDWVRTDFPCTCITEAGALDTGVAACRAE